jgi:hypothetical protein
MDNQKNIPNSEPLTGAKAADIKKSGKPMNEASKKDVTAQSKVDAKGKHEWESVPHGVSNPASISASGKPMNDASKKNVVADSKKNTKYPQKPGQTAVPYEAKANGLTIAAAPKINKKSIKKNT